MGVCDFLVSSNYTLFTHILFVTQQIDQAQLRDAGWYTCEASNDAGRSEKHYNVVIWGKRLIQTVLAALKRFFFKE